MRLCMYQYVWLCMAFKNSICWWMHHLHVTAAALFTSVYTHSIRARCRIVCVCMYVHRVYVHMAYYVCMSVHECTHVYVHSMQRHCHVNKYIFLQWIICEYLHTQEACMCVCMYVYIICIKIMRMIIQNYTQETALCTTHRTLLNMRVHVCVNTCA